VEAMEMQVYHADYLGNFITVDSTGIASAYCVNNATQLGNILSKSYIFSCRMGSRSAVCAFC